MGSARIVMPALIGVLALGQEVREVPRGSKSTAATTTRAARVARTRRSAAVSELFPLPWLLVVGAAEEPVPADASPIAARK
jgi:hypothetical protein